MINRTFTHKDEYSDESQKYRVLQFVPKVRTENMMTKTSVRTEVLLVCEHIDTGRVCWFNISDDYIDLDPIEGNTND